MFFASLVILIGYNSVGLTKQIWEQCDNEGESSSQTANIRQSLLTNLSYIIWKYNTSGMHTLSFISIK